MKKCLLLFIFFLLLNKADAQGDDCSSAMQLTSVSNYCSSNGTFTNVLSTPSTFLNATCWGGSVTNDVWFKFTSIGTDVLFSVNGLGYHANTLIHPNLAIFQGDCNTIITEIGCFSNASTCNSTIYKGGLIIGTTYLLRVSTESAFSGIFDICINNYTPAFSPSSDCIGAAYLCDKSPVSVGVLNGSGNINEGYIPGTCFNIAPESNSSWFKWECKTSGNLTMDIVGANPSDDIDWILFELTGGVNNCASKVPLRCNVSSCPSGTGTFSTGMRSNDTDIFEPPNCNAALYNSYTQDVNLIANHSYALFVNNYSSTSAFTLNWGGTSQFKGPVADFVEDSIVLCNAKQFIFNGSSSVDYTNLTWSFSGSSSPSSAVGVGPHSVNFSSPGTYSVVLQASDANACSSSKNITIVVPSMDSPQVNVVSTIEPICNSTGTISALNVTGGVAPYLYSLDGVDFYNSNLFDSLTAGTYILSVKDSNGCIVDTAINLNSSSLNMPQIDVVSTIAPICSSKGTITASAVTGGVTPYTYSLNGVAFYNSNLFDSLTAGTYILSVKDSNGCLVDTVINLNSSSLNMPEIDLLSINEPFCNIKGIITVDSVSGGQPPYLYSLNGVDFYNSNFFNDVSAGTYFLAIKDTNGCLADTLIDVYASFFNEVPIIPNCLTPNNDKINDEWYIESDCVEEFKCTILNRWGQIVKTMTDITEKWDGLYNDELLSEGVYNYILEIKYYNSPTTTMSGFITLIR